MNLANKKLWDKVSGFDLDKPPSEYGFSTRLAYENFWTKEFTKLAILEYKKFMYLAATTDFMVSPSEIVDTVWHQHLIFTKSYQEFCNLLGKQIQHIPSTHNKEDFEKFKQAKERTTKFYEREFGAQPAGIWAFPGMFESLNLEKSKFKLRSFINFGILAFLLLTIPFYYLLKPLYIEINNPQFLPGIIILSVFTFAVLEFFNKATLSKITSLFDRNSFVYDLHPYELVYMKTQDLNNVINGTVNELVEKEVISINGNNSIELAQYDATINKEQLQVTAVLTEIGTTYYPALLRRLKSKPIFVNSANCMDAFMKYFHKSKRFNKLFYINFFVFTILLLLAFTRIVTGIVREKPILFIALFTIILSLLIAAFLYRLTQQEFTSIIPDLYRRELLLKRKLDNNWQWNYFLAGSAVLATSFIPLAAGADKKYNSRGPGGACSSCGGGSCGSSCGSSCGGCGGCGS